MRVREATLEDAPRIMELALCFLETTAYGAIVGKTNPARMAPLLDMCMTRGVVLLAETDPSPEFRPHVVGFLAALAMPHPVTAKLYVDEVAWFVEQECRNGLAGPKLLRALEDWATTKSISVVKMVAPAGSSVGDFLERRGYRAVETAYQRTL
jgi:hypothetical protein